MSSLSYAPTHEELTNEQQEISQRMMDRVLANTRVEMEAMIRFLASVDKKDMLGQAEFMLRARGHQMVATAIESALDERKKGGIAGRA